MHKCFLGHPLSLHLNSFSKRAKLLQHRLRILRNTLPYGLGKRERWGQGHSALRSLLEGHLAGLILLECVLLLLKQ